MASSSKPPLTDTARLARQQVISRRLDPALTDDLHPNSALTSVHPWLLLHRGRCLCRLRSDFPQARMFVDVALTLFRNALDGEGELWALIERVVLCYHEQAFAQGEALLAAIPLESLRPYVRAEFLFGRFLCAIGLDHLREAEACGHQALDALDHESDPWLQRLGRIQMLRNQAAAYHYLGRTRMAVQAAEQALTLASQHPDTAETEPWCCYELGLAYWRKGEFTLAASTLDNARRLAESWRHRELWRWAVATEGHLLRDGGQLAEARAAYALADGWGEDIHGPILLQIREGRLADARWACEAMITLAQKLGSPIYEADGRVLLGLVNLQAGRPAAALELFSLGNTTYVELEYRYNLTSVRYYQAAALLALNRGEEANSFLEQALHFSAAEEVYNTDWWMPDLMETLLLRAIQWRIEPAHAQRMVERRFLSAPVSIATSSTQRAPLKAEMEIARQTQLSLLPSAAPFMPDLDIAGMSLPAEEVGGDFYGFYPAGADPSSGSPRELGLALSDISGKGLQSALLTSGTAVAISTAVAERPRPGQLLSLVHSALRPYTARSRLYVALCYAVLAQQKTNWLLTAANAGAIPPVVRRVSGQVEWIDAMGLPLGGSLLSQHGEVTTALLPGDIVILLSDGIIEAMNRDREMFGIDRLEQALAVAPHEAGARSVLQHLLTAVQMHVDNAPQHDDITLVVVKVEAVAPTPR